MGNGQKSWIFIVSHYRFSLKVATFVYDLYGQKWCYPVYLAMPHMPFWVEWKGIDVF